MNKNYMVSLIAVIVLFLIAYVGAQQGTGPQMVFGIIVPYLAVILFVVGFARRILGWSRGLNRPKSTTRHPPSA
jgi:nitrate reductase gamma subunit